MDDFDFNYTVQFTPGTYVRLSTNDARPRWYLVIDSCTLQRAGFFVSVWLTIKKFTFIMWYRLFSRSE